MKKVILILSAFSWTCSFAQNLTLGHTTANDLLLKGNSCEKLIEQHEKICQWKQRIEPLFEIPAINHSQCRALAKNSYSMTVSSCLPTFVKENHNKPLQRSGANCWGTAMSFKGISDTPRFIWSDEMTYWMNSPICRKLAEGEEKEAGDILNVFGPEYVFSGEDETQNKGYLFWKALNPKHYTESPVRSGYSGYHNFLHSETYISSEMTFGKNSPSYEDEFRFNLLKNVYGRSHTEECQENQSIEANLRENQNESQDIKGRRCDYFTNVYRCENFNTYFLEQNLTDEEQIVWVEINALKEIQNKLFPLLHSKSILISKTEQKSFLEEADMSAAEALSQLASGAMTKNKEMLLTLQYFTAQGIRKSMELARLIPATEAL